MTNYTSWPLLRKLHILSETAVFFNDLWDGQKFNTKVPWNEKEATLFSQAEKNWVQLSHQK